MLHVHVTVSIQDTLSSTHTCMYFIEAIIQQQSDDIEVPNEELYKRQHSSGK